MLNLKNVSKFYYNKGIIATGFNKVNLELKIGEFVVITGESGSGKSTLLNVISGIDSYEEGEMYIEGKETSHYTERDFEDYRRKYIANIFQSFNLINSYTVYQNVELVMLLNGYKKRKVKKKILEIIDQVGLTKFKNTKVSKLSGGQKQRVAIARAMVKDTPIIVADEPTGNLDTNSANEVIEILKKVAKNKLVIVVTHNIEQVEKYATRIVKMNDGRIVENTEIKKIEEEPKAQESEYKNISIINKYRLGIRNTFNIVTKFLLLFAVFFFSRMPQNEYEIVIDKRVVDDMINDSFSMIRAMGIKNEEELMNKVVTIDGMKEFTIVGFSNNGSKSIYVDKSLFINILNNMTASSFGMGLYMQNQDNTNVGVKDYNLYLDDITLKKGKLPVNDYEVIVNISNKDEMKLNKTIKNEVNGKQLKVVGYYESKTNKQEYLVNNNTVKYDVISKNNGFTIYPKNKELLLEKFRNDYQINIIDKYETDKQNYLDKKQEEIKSTVIFASIILAISLIEIYLMMRSSFLSRIKEVGVLRAIGVKKADIYRMFLGEILSITTFTSMPGVVLMTYILSQVSKIKYVNRMFIVNFNTIGLSIAIIYAFNILIGLLPLYKVIKKTPAKILARHDVE